MPVTIENTTFPDKKSVSIGGEGNNDVFVRNIATPHNISFSGCDILTTVYTNGKLLFLQGLDSISISTHREVVPVRTLGMTNPAGFVRGPRTISGSLVFVMFDREPMFDILGEYKSEVNVLESTPLPDSLPPFDITITYLNEYGNAAVCRLYGVQITDDGFVHSINDMITENVKQYVAMDLDTLVPVGDQIPWTANEGGEYKRNLMSLLDFQSRGTLASNIGEIMRAISLVSLMISDYENNQEVIVIDGIINIESTDTSDLKKQLLSISSSVPLTDKIGYDLKDINGKNAEDLYKILSSLNSILKSEESTLNEQDGWNVLWRRDQINNRTNIYNNPFDGSNYKER